MACSMQILQIPSSDLVASDSASANGKNGKVTTVFVWSSARLTFHLAGLLVVPEKSHLGDKFFPLHASLEVDIVASQQQLQLAHRHSTNLIGRLHILQVEG